MDNGRIGKRQTGDPTVVACVVFQTRDPEHLLELLREALTGIADPVPETKVVFTSPRNSGIQVHVRDSSAILTEKGIHHEPTRESR
jgi:hypothetical protein